MMPDLLHYFLTGVASNEFSDACTTGLYNQAEHGWEPRIMEALGLPADLYSTPIAPGTRLGPVRPGVCAELEIRPVEVITPATHDTASAVAGIPARETDPPWAFISIGTWGVVGVETGAPLLTDAVLDAGWGNEGGADGGSILAVNVAGLWPIQQCRQKWMRDRGAELPWDEVMQAARAAAPLRALVDIDDPVFAPLSPDEPLVVAEYCRARGLRPPEGMGAIARCLYESLALKFRWRIEQLRRLSGRRIELLRLVGGGARNEALCQWTADATGIPVEAGPAETTVAGNLIVQLKGSGEVGSIDEGRAVVARSCPTTHYDPSRTAPWNEAYAGFLRQLADR